MIFFKDEITSSGILDREFKRDIIELHTYLTEKVLSEHQKIYVIAKILLGSKALSQTEMGETIEYLLSLCGNEDERREVKRNLANELLNYQGLNHGRNLIGMVWTLA